MIIFAAEQMTSHPSYGENLNCPPYDGFFHLSTREVCLLLKPSRCLRCPVYTNQNFFGSMKNGVFGHVWETYFYILIYKMLIIQNSIFLIVAPSSVSVDQRLRINRIAKYMVEKKDFQFSKLQELQIARKYWHFEVEEAIPADFWVLLLIYLLML